MKIYFILLYVLLLQFNSFYFSFLDLISFYFTLISLVNHTTSRGCKNIYIYIQIYDPTRMIFYFYFFLQQSYPKSLPLYRLLNHGLMLQQRQGLKILNFKILGLFKFTKYPQLRQWRHVLGHCWYHWKALEGGGAQKRKCTYYCCGFINFGPTKHEILNFTTFFVSTPKSPRGIRQNLNVL